MKLETILVAVDFSESSRQALAYAAFLAAKFKARIQAVYVWEPPRYLPTEPMMGAPVFLPVQVERAAREGAEKELADLVRPFKSQDVSIETMVTVGLVSDSIVEAAKRGVDLVVMGTHGRGALGHLFLGSVAARVSAQAPCPVVTVKASERKG